MDEVPGERLKAEPDGDHLLNAFHDDVLHSMICQLPKPIRFGQRYRDSLAKAENVRVLLNSHAIEIEEAESARTVSLVHAMTKTGRKHRLAAKIFVLACGGLETTRLLLASKRKDSRGIGNEHDLVGRFYMQHPKGSHGHLMLQRASNARAYANGYRVNDCLMQASISLSEEFQRKEGLLNHHVMLAPLLQLSESDVASLYRQFHATWWQVRRGAALRQGAVAAAVDIPKVAVDIFGSTLRSLSRGMAPYRVVSHLEQPPNPASRLELSEDADRFGVPQLRTKWRIDTSEKRSLCRLHELLRDNLERYGIGSFRSQLNPEMDNWPISSSSAHDLGTARMHDDPRRGVTDANGRVHGLHNLYVIGGALFPTSGSANPTLTIVALALRMADFLMTRTCGTQATSSAPE